MQNGSARSKKFPQKKKRASPAPTSLHRLRSERCSQGGKGIAAKSRKKIKWGCKTERTVEGPTFISPGLPDQTANKDWVTNSYRREHAVQSKNGCLVQKPQGCRRGNPPPPKKPISCREHRRMTRGPSWECRRKRGCIGLRTVLEEQSRKEKGRQGNRLPAHLLSGWKSPV